MARPTKCTAAITTELAKYLRQGNWIETSTALVGLNQDTFHRWLKRGARALTMLDQGKTIATEEDIYIKFSEAIKKAMAQAEQKINIAVASQLPLDIPDNVLDFIKEFRPKIGREPLNFDMAPFWIEPPIIHSELVTEDPLR